LLGAACSTTNNQVHQPPSPAKHIISTVLQC
jgi:hypothetical protein